MQTGMDKQWPRSWDALREGPKPTEKTCGNVGKARLPGRHLFSAANAFYVAGVPWLEEGDLRSVVVPTGDWKHPIEALGL